MPANVTPEYERAERQYRAATTDEERLAALQEMLSTVPKHKGTEKMQADIKRRISQLRKAGPKGGISKGPDPFHIPKSGAGQVVLMGPPNTGKSSLLAATTNAEAKVAEYPFTTVVPQPGMWVREGVAIELVDTPPLTAEHVPAGLMGTIRGGDIVCVVAEVGPAALEQVEGVREILSGRGLELRTISREQLDPTDPGLRCGLVLLNKADGGDPAELASLRELYGGALEVLTVSARTGTGLEGWFQVLWRLLAVIRVFAKQPGHPPDLGKPFVLPVGSTVEDLARHIHRDLPLMMRHARIWGEGRHDGQLVHRVEPLREGDVVEIHE